MEKKSPLYPEDALILAPLSGYTDLPYRRAARSGGCRYAFTEMVDAAALTYARKRSEGMLLRGAEVDIVSLEGGLFAEDIACPESIVGHAYRADKSLFERVVGDLDYLIASVHNGSFADGATVAQTTRMYTAVLERPDVLVLGHAGRSGVPFDVDEVLSCARAHHKLIEINNHSLESRRHHGACRAIAERAAELGVGIVVSSDAHIAPAIGQFPHAERLLEEIHFPEELIMNRNREALVGALAAAGFEL